nr:putative VP2 [Enterovirus H]
SPSAEACGYSDRVAQLTIGNSTITTQEAANVVVAYGQWPEYLDSKDATAVDKPTQPDVASNRFYTLKTVSWEKSSTGWYWKFSDCLASVGLFGQNVQYHYLGRYGLAVHVQCNASKFHQGTLLVLAIPEWEIGVSNADRASFNLTNPDKNGHTMTGQEAYCLHNGTNIHSSLVFPHQFINLRTNNCATLVLPYVGATPLDTPIKHNVWSLVVIPVVPLDYTTGATTQVPITITMAPMACEFNGLRNAITQ